MVICPPPSIVRPLVISIWPFVSRIRPERLFAKTMVSSPPFALAIFTASRSDTRGPAGTSLEPPSPKLMVVVAPLSFSSTSVVTVNVAMLSPLAKYRTCLGQLDTHS